MKRQYEITGYDQQGRVQVLTLVTDADSPALSNAADRLIRAAVQQGWPAGKSYAGESFLVAHTRDFVLPDVPAAETETGG